MDVVETFSENQTNYEAYRARLDAIRTQATIETSLANALAREQAERKAKEHALAEVLKERQAKEQVQLKYDQLMQELNQTRQNSKKREDEEA